MTRKTRLWKELGSNEGRGVPSREAHLMMPALVCKCKSGPDRTRQIFDKPKGISNITGPGTNTALWDLKRSLNKCNGDRDVCIMGLRLRRYFSQLFKYSWVILIDYWSKWDLIDESRVNYFFNIKSQLYEALKTNVWIFHLIALFIFKQEEWPFFAGGQLHLSQMILAFCCVWEVARGITIVSYQSSSWISEFGFAVNIPPLSLSTLGASSHHSQLPPKILFLPSCHTPCTGDNSHS